VVEAGTAHLKEFVEGETDAFVFPRPGRCVHLAWNLNNLLS
jgi:hypothetical protein